jgi:hypothetical protein
MTLVARLRSWWRATRHPARMESEMDAELQAHMESHAEYLIAAGVPADEAHRRARLEFGPVGQAKEVGVAGDVRQYKLETTPPMQFYLPLWQTGEWSANIVARTTSPPDRLASAMRTLVRNLDPAVAAGAVRTGDEIVAGATAERRFETFLLTAFGGIALFLSLVGLYALMTYSVEQRTAEIGIRMALGAQPRSVMRLVLHQGSRLALAGIALGFACSWLVTRTLASLLFEVKPTDLPTFFAVACLFCAIALAACCFPARRATGVDPLMSLRAE